MKCRENTDGKNPKAARAKNFHQNVQGVVLAILAIIKDREASGLLSSLGIKSPLIKIIRPSFLKKI